MTVFDKIALTIDSIWITLLLMLVWVIICVYDGDFEVWKKETMKNLSGKITLVIYYILSYGLIITLFYWPLSYIWIKL